MCRSGGNAGRAASLDTGEPAEATGMPPVPVPASTEPCFWVNHAWLGQVEGTEWETGHGHPSRGAKPGGMMCKQHVEVLLALSYGREAGLLLRQL